MKKLITVLFIITSCSFFNVENEIPDNLIPEEKMVDIIYDMSIISVSKGVNKRILENNGMRPKDYILNKYEIDSLQFVVSNKYYSQNLEKYLYIYENVLNKLENNREEVTDSIEKKNEKRVIIDQQTNQGQLKNNKNLKPKFSSILNSNILEN
tara:strand:- start:78 stop:536 length:459 start_codon:yes stop_codon:yes gene_type:complete